MSTPTTTSSTASGPAAAHGPAGLRKAAAGADLFASLLALVGDTRLGSGLNADALAADPAGREALATDPLLPDGVDLAPPGSADNPLTQLLSWNYPAALGDLSTLAGGKGLGHAGGDAADATRRGAGPALITPQSLQPSEGLRPAPGIEISGLGLVAVAPGAPADAETSAWLARSLPASAGQPAGPGLPQPAASLGAQAIDRAVITTSTPAGQEASLPPPRLAGAQAPLRASAPAEPMVRASTDAATAAGLDKGRKTGPSVTATLQARDAASSDTARMQQHLVAASSRSTVALDGRNNPPSFRLATPEVGATTAPVVLANGQRAPASSRTTPGDPVVSALGEPASAAARPAEATLRTDDASAYAQAPAADGETPGHLGAHTLRHASLRVGDGSAEAIDVQLSITGQEVRVDFRSDSAETRHGLQQSAAPALGELLERSGMQLGSVSVGGQGLASGGGHGPSAGAGGERRSPERDPRESGSAEPVAQAAPRPRADGSRPLDVFA